MIHGAPAAQVEPPPRSNCHPLRLTWLLPIYSFRNKPIDSYCAPVWTMTLVAALGCGGREGGKNHGLSCNDNGTSQSSNPAGPPALAATPARATAGSSRGRSSLVRGAFPKAVPPMGPCSRSRPGRASQRAPPTRGTRVASRAPTQEGQEGRRGLVGRPATFTPIETPDGRRYKLEGRTATGALLQALPDPQRE